MRNITLPQVHRFALALALGAGALLGGCKADAPDEALAEGDDATTITLNHDEAGRRVDVLVGGKPFTSYLYTDTLAVLKKPVLYPIYSPDGTALTRGYPLDPRPGERVDHPHHIGLWFNYGDVNGLDFWNNSDAIPAERAKEMGAIRHQKINGMQGGAGEGTLDVTEEWVDAGGKVMLREDTRYAFHAEPGVRMIDRITKLTAQGEAVSLKDNKEGVLGLRLTRGLEHPSKDKAEVYADASGQATTVQAMGNEGVTGRYRSSEGKEGDAVWGTRGKWTMLSGVVEGDSVVIAILDHPGNPGFPTYWHARGYGLFAANPLGQAALSGGKETLNFSLAAGQSTTFRHRIIIFDGARTPEEVEQRYAAWAGAAR